MDKRAQAEEAGKTYSANQDRIKELEEALDAHEKDRNEAEKAKQEVAASQIGRAHV